jgi:peroxiredoxin
MTLDRKIRRSAFEEASQLGAPLGRRLDVYTRRIAETSPKISAAYDRLIARLVATGEATDTPGPGDVMPNFAMPDDRGRLVSLDELVAEGPLVLSLNRGHWCGYCKLELRHLAEIQQEVESLGARIVSITPDRQRFSETVKDEQNLQFSVLTDLDNSYALSLGLLVWLGPEIRTIYAAGGRDLSQFQGNNGWFVPIPATFIITEQRRVLVGFVDADFRRRMAAEEILAALRRTDEQV